MSRGGWVVRALLAAAAIATGAFARRVHDRKVRLIGRRFAAGERTPRAMICCSTISRRSLSKSFVNEAARLYFMWV